MIAVNINAGLANQMFHYAFGRGLVAKGIDVYFDQSNFKPRKELVHEFISLQDAFPDIEMKIMPKWRFRFAFLSPEEERRKNSSRFNYFMPKILKKIGYEKYFYEPTYSYINGLEKKAVGNIMFRGFWQSEKYFKHCTEDIRKQFTFLPFDESRNIDVASKMANENSVAIHLRKGKDYLQSDLLGKGLCGIDYYNSAIQYIKEHISNPIFYVFTDNPDWVKDNLTSLDFTLVDWNSTSGNKSFRDMQLMTCCKHNIIANSTYSWWGAWLNSNPSKIVIGPKTFFNPINDFFSKQDIMCDNWIAL